ncbi:hypothetical protein [Sedimentitalea todarodis]|uniref:Uncharacterized protein n=1 Tax=Sedimentitalea todarodis TaxID=1631240 RepID=A0ABU3VDG3_9RHOB|nr:hypothetical protein [Sedimentitalea todarodis]MDU9004218.1 hypothetical protein [Sedimentitalea todarodis]
MPSLVITKNDGGPKYQDWDVVSKRRLGQVFTGEKLLTAFGVSGTDPGAIVHTTLQACLDHGYSIWMRYNGEVNDSFAIVDAVTYKGFRSDLDEEWTLSQEERDAEIAANLKKFKVELNYEGIDDSGYQTSIVRNGKKGTLTLLVREDTPAKNPNNKKKTMNVTIPGDFELFDDMALGRKQYLVDMAEDVRNLTTDEDDVDYLLSSLTFRRCL